MIEQYLLVLLAGRCFYFCKRGINVIVLFAFNIQTLLFRFVKAIELRWKKRLVLCLESC